MEEKPGGQTPVLVVLMKCQSVFNIGFLLLDIGSENVMIVCLGNIAP
jgi:hypothetical protein